MSHFFYFSAVFEELANLSCQELLFNHILKECQIPKVLQTIRKKADTILISVHLKSNSHFPKKIIFICFNDSPSKMLRNAFLFHLKSSFVLKMFEFLSWLFGHVGKRFGWKDKVNFATYDVATWLTKNYNRHIAQYLKAARLWNLVS